MKDRFRLLFAPADDQPPASGGGGGSDSPESTPENPPSGDEAPAEDPPAGDEPPAEDPAPSPAPEAAAAPLNAFQRGALRALGIGGLTSKVEDLQGQLQTRDFEIHRLKTENARLTAELAKKPAEIAAAQKVGESAVQNAVAAELQTLGLTPEKAPSALSEEQTRKTLTRAEFDKLNHQARNTFIREGGKVEG